MRRILALIGFLLGLAGPATAQDAASLDLLLRTNNLRGGLGLQTYRWNEQLAAAARSHAMWLATTNRDCRSSDCHRDDAGRFAHDRARIAGYGGERVHENYFRGGDASVESAWRFWLNSSVHYSNLTSGLTSEVGIGRALSNGRHALVIVFGHNSGGGFQANASNVSQARSSAPPSYVLGLDEYGNIKHQIQPAQTIGDIALIYGYTWDDIPYMLEINGKNWDDIRQLQPGEVFLVPPQNGTYTPIPATPTMIATASATATVLAATDIPGSPTPTASATMTDTNEPTREIRIAPVETASPQPLDSVGTTAAAASVGQVFLLGLAILLQLGIIGGAGVAYWRRSH